MATSSITKNFVISGKEQVEMFADAIEASMNDNHREHAVSAQVLNDRNEIAQLMNKWKANHGR